MSTSRPSSRNNRSSDSIPIWTHQPGRPMYIYTKGKSTKLTREELELMPSYEKRHYLHRWSDYHSVCYNALLDMEIAPTQYLSCKILHNLGLREPVMDMLARIGVGNLIHHCDVYPEMTRQFLASAEVHYYPLTHPVASKSYLSYFYNGRRYQVTFEQLCVIYGFDPSPNHCFIDEYCLQQMPLIWPAIASHGSFPDHAPICAIRNPVLRVVATFLRRTLLPTEDLDMVSPGLLFIMLLGLDQNVLAGLGLGFDLRTWSPINLGAVFAWHLVQRKFRGLGPSPAARDEIIGSLITPIFCHSKHASKWDNDSISEIRFLDNKFWDSSKVFHGDIYEFHGIGHVGTSVYCRLPILPWTTCKTLDSVRFDLPENLLCTATGSTILPHPSESHSIRSCDSEFSPLSCPLHGFPLTSPQPFLPPLPSEFSLPPRPKEDASLAPHLYHLEDCVTSLHQMQSAMWNHFSRVAWYRPPRCCVPSTNPSPSFNSNFVPHKSDDDVEEDPSYSKDASSQL